MAERKNVSSPNILYPDLGQLKPVKFHVLGQSSASRPTIRPIMETDVLHQPSTSTIRPGTEAYLLGQPSTSAVDLVRKVVKIL